MQIKNIKELRDDLLTIYDDLKNKRRTAKEAHALANISNKIIHSASVQLNYNKHMGKKSEINFLEAK